VASSGSESTPAPGLVDGPPPVIGLTTYLQQAQTGVWDVRASFLPAVYLDAVTKSGGIAVLLPPQRAAAEVVERVLDGLDGLIVTGGRDVDPARYGQAPHPETDQPATDRDEWEDALLLAAIQRELPFLGICRGAQVLNVALGGTLIQHLPDVVGSNRYNIGGDQFNQVAVEVEPGSELSDLVGAGVAGRVHHHQAIDRLGSGLSVSARAEDGIIQAIELGSVPFGVAVQWHPEETPDDLRLFTGLVEAAREYNVRAPGATRGPVTR
jgi:putative glutamine amidotransferase